MKVFEGFVVGQNARENWQLLDNPPEYWWFHLESFPSPFVIATTAEPTDVDLHQAAQLCKAYSKYRNYRNVYVTYTQLRNVSRGDKPGEVEVCKTRRIKV